MINPEDLKYTYIEHLSTVTTNTKVKKLHVKSPESIKIENKKNKLMLKLDSFKFDINSLKSMIWEMNYTFPNSFIKKICFFMR